jgi:pimeloyl-ACP methyl ester carboxylesterase
MADLVCRGVRLHVQRLGEPGRGTPVVFVHGLVMDNLSSWYFTLANAAARTNEVILYDLRGHGLSERPATGYTSEDMVADLAAVLDGLGVDRPVALVGNSFGGMVALAFARAFPHRVDRIVLVDAHVGGEGFGEEMVATLSLDGEERDRKIAEHFASWLGRHSARKRTRLADTAEALVRGTSLVEDLRRTPRVTAVELAGIQAPVLALYGERSDIVERCTPLLGAMPACTLELVPGCTHSLLWEATDEVRRRALAFLEPA